MTAKAHPRSCVKCEHEETCGYSHLATIGKRTECSFTECCLGDMSNGQPFFEAAVAKAQTK